ncbi:C1 family peptidase [Lactiplantibacillus plantarum]|uniref:C1 family peptidase n=1 Tax=Lactiplantibacillus plantarum TaxID=1590 RepID=UPI000E2912FE|nr:C1 family peptidase [Lactiplantibacillus plantarum]BBA81985.1 cysteine aminopeptidase [Lactiplantibacillus plantarum]
MATELTPDALAALRTTHAQDRMAPVLTRAITKNGIEAASFDNQAASRLERTFSVEVPTGKVSNQKHSGRCWEFSLLNTLRHKFATRYHVKDFELSQNYLFFWDKIERANIFYRNVEQTARQPIDDRLVQFLFANPGEDGGQWAMAASLVQKYGVVPASVMPESFNTDNTTAFQASLSRQLRKDGLKLRQLVMDGASEAELQSLEKSMLQTVYRMTAYSFGEPPTSFDLEYRDDEQQYHRTANLTPQQFYQDYFETDLDDYVVVTNSPDKPFNRLYSLPDEDNVIGGKPIEFLNLDMGVLTDVAVQQLQAGETVWFGNDVLRQMDRKTGYLDAHLFETGKLFGTNGHLTKAQRLLTGEGEVSHAMTLTGVDLVADTPTKWKVENSWGEQVGDQGYFVMSQDWFNEYVYEVVVHKHFLAPEFQALLNERAQRLPAWDPLH